MMLALDPADRSSVHELLRHLTATTHEEPVSYICTLQLCMDCLKRLIALWCDRHGTSLQSSRHTIHTQLVLTRFAQESKQQLEAALRAQQDAEERAQLLVSTAAEVCRLRV